MYRSFELLKRLDFVKTSGTKEELEAATILRDECLALGADDAKIETFEVDAYKIKKAHLCLSDPKIEVECAGVGISGNTDGLITKEFVYVDSLEALDFLDVEDKICLVTSKLVNYKIYEKLAKNKAAGLILCTGSVYSSKEEVDLDPYMYRERHYKYGKIPAVCIRMADAENILKIMPKFASMELVQEEYKTPSYNVVATINGASDEVVCFSAHLDSVAYSKGIYDNATGCTGIMQVLSHFAINKPKRTLKFIFCGSEECGLLGSKAYCRDHKEELEKYRLNINIDMIGVTIGYDIACISGEDALTNYISYLGKEVGFPINASSGVYSSDSTPFADHNVPSLSFARLSPKGGAEIHSRKDVIDNLSEANYYRTTDFITTFASRLINAVSFPVKKEIPQTIKDKIDTYYGREK